MKPNDTDSRLTDQLALMIGRSVVETITLKIALMDAQNQLRELEEKAKPAKKPGKQ